MGRLQKLWESMASGRWFEQVGQGQWPGAGGPPQSLTEEQQRMFMRWFHEDYGRYPVSEYEFRQWLHENW